MASPESVDNDSASPATWTWMLPSPVRATILLFLHVLFVSNLGFAALHVH